MESVAWGVAFPLMMMCWSPCEKLSMSTVSSFFLYMMSAGLRSHFFSPSMISEGFTVTWTPVAPLSEVKNCVLASIFPVMGSLLDWLA
jgi:hypothetical protein